MSIQKQYTDLESHEPEKRFDYRAYALEETSFKQAENGFRVLAENANDGIALVKMDGSMIYANKYLSKISGYDNSDLLQCHIDNLVVSIEGEKVREFLRIFFEVDSASNRLEFNLIEKSGRSVPVEASLSKIVWYGHLVSMMIVRDLTSYRLNEADLIREQLRLEHRVQKRTRQLLEANKALSVLARNLDRKKDEEIAQIAREIHSTILPIIGKFESRKAFAKNRSELEVLRVCLKKIGNPSGKASPIMTLTATELQVAVMIKDALNNLKIADQLNVSLNTIKTHRRNIRKKLDLCNSKINLAAYLRANMP